MKTSNQLISLSLALCGFIWVIASRIPPDTGPIKDIQAPQQGFLAPDFELQTISGEPLSLADLRGKAVILNFWASWCPPCRSEMPAFDQASLEFGSSSLAIIGVNAANQDSRSDVEDFIRDYQLTFPILLDENGVVGRAYQVQSLPTTFFIDKQGVIKEVLVGGPIPLSLLRVKTSDLLKEKRYVPDN